MFTNVQALFVSLVNWFISAIPIDRLNGDNTGRKWVTQQIGYTDDFTLANLQTITDRSDINQQITTRIPVQDVNQKQGIAGLKVELSTLYSFQKCFVARHKTRLQYYRDDLSQKGQRNLYAVQLSYEALNLLETQLNKQN